MIYRIEPEVFEDYPTFCRGIVVAKGVDNSRPDERIKELLLAEQERVRADAGCDPDSHPRVLAWHQVYQGFGANPAKHTPSIAFLLRRIKSGKTIQSISPVVDIFNYISLRYLVPAGGDTIDAIFGDLTLGRATGSETFAPIFKPEMVEQPEPGEVIYVNRREQRVLCRRWNWRNADFSKITPQSRNVVINVDGLTSVVERTEIEEATEALASLLLRSCQGLVSVHFLDRNTSEIAVLSAAA